jgi:hypothetical protein
MRKSRFEVVRFVVALIVVTLLSCALLTLTAGDRDSEMQAGVQPVQPVTVERLQTENEIARLLKIGESQEFEPALASLLKPYGKHPADEFLAVNEKTKGSEKNDPADTDTYRRRGDHVQ